MMYRNLKTKVKKLVTKHIWLTNVLLGGLFGFFILAPLGMVIVHLTHNQVHTLMDDLADIYLFRNISWLLLFTAIGGSIGFLFGFLHKKIFQLKEQLQHKEKLATIGQLSAGLAHEINTPLTNIALLAENIEPDIDDPSVKSKIRDIQDQVQSASTIISGLLVFSKRTKPELMDVDVNDLVRHTIELVRTWKRTDVEIKLNLSNSLPLAKGDHGQLEQVFLNIIKNAHDAMTDGGKLEIITKKKENYIQVKFKDSGTGISKDRLARLYDPFYTTKKNGVGLGLSICYGIINAHGGWMEVDSKVGRGTSFRLYLNRWAQ